MEYLFVGGAQHKKWNAVPDGRDTWMLYEHTTVPTSIIGHYVVDTTPINILTYRKTVVNMRVGRRYISKFVFLLDGHELIND